METVYLHIFRTKEALVAVCGEETQNGMMLRVWASGVIKLFAYEEWCPACEDAIDPLEQLAATEL